MYMYKRNAPVHLVNHSLQQQNRFPISVHSRTGANGASWPNRSPQMVKVCAPQPVKDRFEIIHVSHNSSALVRLAVKC